jgi:hypothetical protein
LGSFDYLYDEKIRMRPLRPILLHRLPLFYVGIEPSYLVHLLRYPSCHGLLPLYGVPLRPTLPAAVFNPPATLWAILLFLANIFAADENPGILLLLNLVYFDDLIFRY